ncbi:MAG: hypothetical protein ABIS67_12640 [Candidatus Eisenbacteria bacterium]
MLAGFDAHSGPQITGDDRDGLLRVARDSALGRTLDAGEPLAVG